MAEAVASQSIFPWAIELPQIVKRYPQLRFMGSKFRLLPWFHEIVTRLEFDTVLDGFSGSGCVGYLFKAMGKEVTANDSLSFSAAIAKAVVENPGVRIDRADTASLLAYDPQHQHFIERTFRGIFFTPDDLRFLDRVWWNLQKLPNPYKQALAVAALVRSCAKRQPRGVFTVAGDPEHYKDGRRDLSLSIQEHFLEQLEVYNTAAFDNGRRNRSLRSDVFSADPSGYDLVYLDPPYVPRSDDNCYVKRYHFLEGLSCYWQGVEILETSRVKKIKKPFTPFSYRKTALEAFDRLFRQFSRSIIVLSYSSNGYPDLQILVNLMERYKNSIVVYERPHRYHFGTHRAASRNDVMEFLVVGE